MVNAHVNQTNANEHIHGFTIVHSRTHTPDWSARFMVQLRRSECKLRKESLTALHNRSHTHTHEEGGRERERERGRGGGECTNRPHTEFIYYLALASQAAAAPFVPPPLPSPALRPPAPAHSFGKVSESEYTCRRTFWANPPIALRAEPDAVRRKR